MKHCKFSALAFWRKPLSNRDLPGKGSLFQNGFPLTSHVCSTFDGTVLTWNHYCPVKLSRSSCNRFTSIRLQVDMTVFDFNKKELKIDRSLGEFLQILSITLFEKIPMNQVLRSSPLQPEEAQSYKQLKFFEF